MLQILGRELGVRDLIPETEAATDDRDTSLTRLVSITLLPFLGIYAAFGEVGESASQLANEQLFRNGVLSEGPSILGTLTNAATEHPWSLLAGLVTIYLIRRGVDLLHDRTGLRILGILVALIESFFLLVVIMGGVRVWQQAQIWISDRQFMAWLAAVKNAILDALSVISIRLPELVTQLVELPGRRGVATVLGGTGAADHLAGGGRAGVRVPGAVAGRALAQGTALARQGARVDDLRQPRRASPRAGGAATAARRRPGRGGAEGGVPRRHRRQVPAHVPLAASRAPGGHRVPRRVRRGLLRHRDGRQRAGAAERPAPGWPTDLVLVRVRPGHRPGARRALRTAADLSAGRGVPPLPGAVLGEVGEHRHGGVPGSPGPRRPSPATEQAVPVTDRHAHDGVRLPRQGDRDRRGVGLPGLQCHRPEGQRPAGLHLRGRRSRPEGGDRGCRADGGRGAGRHPHRRVEERCWPRRPACSSPSPPRWPSPGHSG